MDEHVSSAAGHINLTASGVYSKGLYVCVCVLTTEHTVKNILLKELFWLIFGFKQLISAVTMIVMIIARILETDVLNTSGF